MPRDDNNVDNWFEEEFQGLSKFIRNTNALAGELRAGGEEGGYKLAADLELKVKSLKKAAAKRDRAAMGRCMDDISLLAVTVYYWRHNFG